MSVEHTLLKRLARSLEHNLKCDCNEGKEEARACLEAVNRWLLDNPPSKPQRYEIWIWENGDVPTICLGVAIATSFKEACDKLAEKDSVFAKLYDREKLTYWGCKLHDRKPRLV